MALVARVGGGVARRMVATATATAPPCALKGGFADLAGYLRAAPTQFGRYFNPYLATTKRSFYSNTAFAQYSYKAAVTRVGARQKSNGLCLIYGSSYSGRGFSGKAGELANDGSQFKARVKRFLGFNWEEVTVKEIVQGWQETSGIRKAAALVFVGGSSFIVSFFITFESRILKHMDDENKERLEAAKEEKARRVEWELGMLLILNDLASKVSVLEATVMSSAHKVKIADDVLKTYGLSHEADAVYGLSSTYKLLQSKSSMLRLEYK